MDLDRPVEAGVRTDTGRSLLDELLGGSGFGLVRRGETLTVDRVGADFVESRGTTRVLVPLELVVLVEQLASSAPAPVASTLLDELDLAAETTPTVVVDTYGGRVRGQLAGVETDHVVVKTWTGRILVSHSAIVAVEFE